MWPGIAVDGSQRPISVSGHVTDAGYRAAIGGRRSTFGLNFNNGETNNERAAPSAVTSMMLPTGNYTATFSARGLHHPGSSRSTISGQRRRRSSWTWPSPNAGLPLRRA